MADLGGGLRTGILRGAMQTFIGVGICREGLAVAGGETGEIFTVVIRIFIKVDGRGNVE